MPLDHTRTIAQSEYDAIWDEACDCGEVSWDQIDIERRQSIKYQDNAPRWGKASRHGSPAPSLIPEGDCPL